MSLRIGQTNRSKLVIYHTTGLTSPGPARCGHFPGHCFVTRDLRTETSGRGQSNKRGYAGSGEFGGIPTWNPPFPIHFKVQTGESSCIQLVPPVSLPVGFPEAPTTHLRTYFSGWIESDLHLGLRFGGLNHKKPKHAKNMFHNNHHASSPAPGPHPKKTRHLWEAPRPPEDPRGPGHRPQAPKPNRAAMSPATSPASIISGAGDRSVARSPLGELFFGGDAKRRQKSVFLFFRSAKMGCCFFLSC